MTPDNATKNNNDRNNSVHTNHPIAQHRWNKGVYDPHTEKTPALQDIAPEFVSYLGAGRAAEVHLVRDRRTGRLYAEKLFQAKGSLSEAGRDIIYWACFQAPFAYHTKENAIKAAMFRRIVLRELTELWFGRPLVADAYYTRWDETAKGHVLGTEYIKGRGPKPGKFDPHTLRNFFKNYPARFFKRLAGMKAEKVEGPLWEIDEVTRQLDALKEKFHQAGFIGSEWQVDKMLSAPTANVLRDKNDKWILVDVESGMPALVLLKHLWAAIKLGSFPLFDDTDFNKLHKYVENNRNDLVEKLGKERFHKLESDIRQLEHHTKAWKSSEPAIFSHKHRLLTDSRLRTNIRKGFAEHWVKTGQISTAKAKNIERSNLHFGSYLFHDYAKSILSGVDIFARSVGRGVRRFADTIGTALRLLYSTLFDETYLKQFSESNVNERIDSWQKSGRLTAAEAAALRPDMNTPELVEYLKGLGFHVGLKPIITCVLFAYAMWVFHDPEVWGIIQLFLASLWVGPATRTLYTLYRMIRTRGRGFSHGTALMVGALPKVGNAAYPIQMATTHPGLASFLQRSVFSVFGCHFPLFGGTDSRIEHVFIKIADFGAAIQYEFANLINGFKSLILPGRKVKSIPDQNKT
ncbi:MAG: hypothetical protein HOC20_03250 [Chloroflexi bacterium]|jgi:hypothetical protein|nr:hypothetical protein [Chloroflexota bacterium]